MNRSHFYLWLALTGVAVPVAAQSQTEAAPTATVAAIQAASNDLSAAMLRGDAEQVGQFLAPNFEWTNRGINWMRQTLPDQLERAKFDALSVKIWTVQLKDGRATAHGYVRARASLNSGTQKGGLDDDYEATWVSDGEDWRLQRDDKLFNLLQHLAPTASQPPVLPVTPPQKPVVILDFSSQWVRAPIAFSRDGSVLAAYSMVDGLRLYAVRTGALLQSIAAPKMVNSLVYAPDGTLVTGHNDGQVRFWDEQGHLKRELSVSKGSIYALSVAPNGGTLAADGGGDVTLFDIGNGRLLKTLKRQGDSARTLAFSPDGEVLAVTAGRRVELWNLNDASLIQTIDGDGWGGFQPDGGTVVVNFGNLRFHRLGSAVVREVFMPQAPFKPRSEVPTLAYIPIISEFFRMPRTFLAPGGLSAVSVYRHGTLGVWDIESGQMKAVLSGFSRNGGDDVDTVVFSPDGKTLAATSRTGEIALWNMSLVTTPSTGEVIVPSVTAKPSVITQPETDIKPNGF